MRLLAWITLLVILAIFVGMIYYLVVGKVIFQKTLSRKNLHDRIMKKQLASLIAEHKIDLCWWDKVKFKKVTIKSKDGLVLVGHYFDAKSDKTALVVHGFGGDYREMQPYVKMFYDKNFNVLAVENRAHGESQGECIGLGWLEKDDLLLWCEYLQKLSPQNKIVLFGLSMGASAVCGVTGELLPTNVVAVVSDCAFDNADRQISNMAKKIKLGKGLIKLHLYSYAKRLHGFDVRNADIIKQVQRTKVPILYIHGDKDELVLVENSKNLFDATPNHLREIFVVVGAGHAQCKSSAGLLYEKRVFDFLKKRTSVY